LGQPSSVTIDSNGDLLISDSQMDRVQKYDTDGNFDASFQLTGLGSPYTLSGRIDVDQAGNIYVGSSVAEAVQKFLPDGTFDSLVGPVGQVMGFGNFAMGVAPDGTLYRENPNNRHLEKYDPDGNFVRRIGANGQGTPTLRLGGLIGTSGGDNQENTILITRTSVDIEVSLNDSGPVGSSVIAGGIIGYGFGSIDSTTAQGQVTLVGSSTYYVGGIAGYFSGAITNSHASNDITVNSDDLINFVAGGLVGFAYAHGIDDDNFISHSAHIEDSYTWGSITTSSAASETQAIGGLAGMMFGGTLKNSFSVETLSIAQNGSPQAVPVSGLVAMILVDPSDVVNNSYDVDRANTDTCFGLAYDPNVEEQFDPETLPCNEVNVDGNDPDYFKDNHTVEPLDNWDFNSVWQDAPDSYPQLKVGGQVIENNSGSGGSGGSVTGPDITGNSLSEVLQTPLGGSSLASVDSANALGLARSEIERFKSIPVNKSNNDGLYLGALSPTGSNLWDAIFVILFLLVFGAAFQALRKHNAILEKSS